MRGPIQLREGVCWGIWLSVILLLACDMGLAQQPGAAGGRQRRRSGPIKQVKLPDPDFRGSMTFETALALQQSVQLLAPTPLSPLDIGQLAWAAQGVIPGINTNMGQADRPLSSDLQLLFVTEDGIYRYVAQGHFLEQQSTPDVRAALAEITLGQQALPTGCGIVIARERLQARRSTAQDRRLLDLRVGQITQILQMQGAALGLASLAAVNIDVQLIRKLCSLDRSIEPLHVLFAGYRPGDTPADRIRQEQIENATNK